MILSGIMSAVRVMDKATKSDTNMMSWVLDIPTWNVSVFTVLLVRGEKKTFPKQTSN